MNRNVTTPDGADTHAESHTSAREQTQKCPFRTEIGRFCVCSSRLNHVVDVPETRYAKSGNVNIAYQVVGNGPFDLIHVPPFVSNLELQWENPDERRYFERLASFSRLIMFDKRGTGLSDRVAVATLEDEWMIFAP